MEGDPPIPMALLLTLVVLALLALWVTRAYPAPTFLESVWRAANAFLRWLLEAINDFIDWLLGSIRR